MKGLTKGAVDPEDIAIAAPLQGTYLDREHVQLGKTSRILRTFPVLFVILLIICVYSIFMAFHILPLLQLDMSAETRDSSMFKRGLTQLIVFHALFLMFAVSYTLSIVTSPGTIPNTEEWTEEEAPHDHVETKKEGTRRYCKWCQKFKPDRAHHCRQCRRCILKMDHHCPWIYNCVGWGNHKSFILCVFYASVTSVFVAVCQVESVITTIDQPQIRFGVVFLLFLGEALVSLLGLVSAAFLCFHVWLVVQNLSTIEFCEKHFRRPTAYNVYSKSMWTNITEVFGTNPVLWLIPIDNRPGDGLHFTPNPETVHLLGSRAPQPYTASD